MVSRGHTREIKQTRIPFWLATLRELRNVRFPGRGGGRQMARHIGISTPSLSNLLQGKRVPGFGVMEKIMKAAGKRMPPWEKAIRKILDAHATNREAAEAIGIAPHTLFGYASGEAKPSEKTMEKIFSTAGMKGFWASVPRKADEEEHARGRARTGARAASVMGEVPAELPADDPYAQAVASLLPHFRSQRAMAKDIGMAITTFNKWLKGAQETKRPSGATVVKLRDALLRHGAPVPQEIERRFQVMEPRLSELLMGYSSQAGLARDLGMGQSRFTLVLDQRKRPTPKQSRRINKLLREGRRLASA